MSKAKILIIDGNQTNRDVMSTMLSQWKITSAIAASAEEGLRLLSRVADQGTPFDIVLLDGSSLGIDEEAIWKAIRDDKRFAKTNLILLSSMRSHSEAEIFKREGYGSFIIKPVTQMVLYKCLIEMLGLEMENGNGSEKIIPSEYPQRSRPDEVA